MDHPHRPVECAEIPIIITLTDMTADMIVAEGVDRRWHHLLDLQEDRQCTTGITEVEEEIIIIP